VLVYTFFSLFVENASQADKAPQRPGIVPPVPHAFGLAYFGAVKLKEMNEQNTNKNWSIAHYHMHSIIPISSPPPYNLYKF